MKIHELGKLLVINKNQQFAHTKYV